MRLLLLIWTMLFVDIGHAARVKDIADVYGVRGNMVSGVGLVTGLNRTGDSVRSEATTQALAKRLQGHGITLALEQIRSRNVAMVMVNTWVPASARPGQRLDVEVSSIGDATSLEGGVLQLTPLFAADRQTYAVAQGAMTVGGYSVEQAGNSSRKNHPTVGRVPVGATVERENPNRVAMDELAVIDWLLKNPDFTTAQRFATEVNVQAGTEIARAIDEGTVSVQVPDIYRGREVDFIASIEAIQVDPDVAARVMINERTGTVVMGADVRISPVAVAYGGLSIEVRRTNSVSQPGMFSGGTTEVISNDAIQVTEGEGQLTLIGGVTMGELVNALNKMGVTPRDLIQILISIQASGALHAELEVI